MRSEDKKILFYFVLFSVVFFLDRLSKIWVLTLCKPLQILPFFSINPGFNQGVSFGMLNSEKNKYLVMLLVAIIICFLLWMIYKRIKNKLTILGEFLLITGALGNLLDRFIYGAVVDFLFFSYKGYSFPAFNISDIAICLGVVIMLFRKDK